MKEHIEQLKKDLQERLKTFELNKATSLDQNNIDYWSYWNYRISEIKYLLYRISAIPITRETPKLTHETKITYLDIAMRVAGFNFKPEHLDMMVCMFEHIIDKQGEANLEQIIKIKTEVEDRHKPQIESAP